eukprot:1165387-Alexandrium_andersonii.AAC.1
MRLPEVRHVLDQHVDLQVRPRPPEQPRRREHREVEGAPPSEANRRGRLLAQPLSHLGELLAG